MTSVEIREYNIPAHLDIEDDIRKRNNGTLTLSLRINNGNIVDYTNTEYVNAKKYFGGGTSAEFQLSVKRNAEKEPPISYDCGERGE